MLRLTFLEKNRISVGIIDLSAYSILKTIEILSNWGVVQRQAIWYLRLPVLFGLQCKKKCPPNVPGKKSLYFNRNYRLIRLFSFEKFRKFIESGVCSKSAKLISQITSNVWAVMQKNGPLKVPRKQVRISIGIIDLFAYSILKNIEFYGIRGLFKSNQIDISDY